MFEETLPILTSKQLVAYTGGIAAVMVGAIELFLGILGGA